jgi:lipoprotein-anchoring transpeptidase ErfK/SrfK
MLQRWIGTALAAALLASAGCTVKDSSDDDNASGDAAASAPAQPQAQAPAQPAPPPMPPPDLRLEVNVAERKLYVYRNDQVVSTHAIAVGTEEWPTRTGEWTVGQVVFNPRWTPPTDEEWAKDEEVAEPGDPDNPLGRIQMVYDPPRSIHGTNEPESLGTAASHGSIRISNADGLRVARMVMQSGGAAKDDAWIQRVQANRTERVEVAIPNPIPIRVISGGDTESSYRPGESSKGKSGSGEQEKDKSGSREKEKEKSGSGEKSDAA